jgi:hypothetical protein
METLKTGDLAFYESFTGLQCCKVLEINGKSGTVSTAQRCKVRITSMHKAWKRGEVIECFAIHVIPRKSVHNSKIALYNVQCDSK